MNSCYSDKLYHQSSVLAIQQLVDSWIISQTVPEGSSIDPQVQVRMAEFPHAEYAENGFWAQVSQFVAVVKSWFLACGAKSGHVFGDESVDMVLWYTMCRGQIHASTVVVQVCGRRESGLFQAARKRRIGGARYTLFTAVCGCVDSQYYCKTPTTHTRHGSFPLCIPLPAD